MSIALTASWTVACASAVFARATSWSRLVCSSPSLVFICTRPVLSFSTVSPCEAIIGAASLASFSNPICLPSAILARLSNLSASPGWPSARSLSAFWEAASALAPHSLAAATSSAWSASAIRRLPIVWATASSASAIELV